MEQRHSDYRAVIARALTGRSVTGTATEFGLPKDAIRYVLQGHDPRLSRAHEICRALGVTFTIGLPERAAHGADDSEIGESSAPDDSIPVPARRTGKVPIRDVDLAELLARLADYWETIDSSERKRLGTGFAAVLDLAGVTEVSALRRHLEYIGWREIEEIPDSMADPDGEG